VKAQAYCGNLKKLATRDCGTETRLPTFLNDIDFSGIDTRKRQELSDFGMFRKNAVANSFYTFWKFKSDYLKKSVFL